VWERLMKEDPIPALAALAKALAAGPYTRPLLSST